MTGTGTHGDADAPLAGDGVVTAGPAEDAVVRRTLGRAFVDDPVWTWLVRGGAYERRTGLALWGFGRVYQRLGGQVLMTRSGEAVAVWAGPHVPKPRPADFGPAVLPMLRAVRPARLRRLAAFDEVDRRHPREPHWYLAILGTDPAHQRRGLGSRVLAPALERADGTGVGCYLESSKAENVPYYRRHGFEVTEEVRLADGRGPTVWLMWRDPR
jgi:ribosomal protein S18 acetylase RimI-like enzyme